jgi:hypothetical protein
MCNAEPSGQPAPTAINFNLLLIIVPYSIIEFEVNPFGYDRCLSGYHFDAGALLLAARNPIGLRHANPMLDTRQYKVEFADGATDVFTANLIAENIYSQVDAEGNSYSIMSEIVDHESDGSAVQKDDGMEVTKDGTSRPRRTTKGWKLLVAWKGGTSSWIPLKDLKESYPIQVAEYALANKILEEPAFRWWARHVLKKRDRIIKKVKSRYWERTHKYSVPLPKTVAEALRMDRETGTDFWQRAIEKEMKNIDCAFEFPADGKAPVSFQKIDCHMIFDVKMTLERKARYVAGGHQTTPTKDKWKFEATSLQTI